MSKVLQDYYPRNVSQYVPLMEFAADVVDGIHKVSLGAPSTADPNGILAAATIGTTARTFTSANWATTFDGSATHVGETVAGTINGRYGRCLSVLGNASTDQIVTITGRDYLGQAMSEALTLNGAVTIYGQKAFKYVDTITTDVGTGGTELTVGWSDVLGLPYRATQLLGWTEDNIHKPLGSYRISVDDVDMVSADTVFGVSSEAGFVTGMSTVIMIANGTGANTCTVEIGGTAVAGLSVVQAASGSIGDVDSDVAITWDQGTTSDIAANAAIEVVSDGGSASTGTLNAYIDVARSVLFVDGDATTATTTTGDTRGLVRPQTACDGSIVFEVQYACLTNNLHGIVQA